MALWDSADLLARCRLHARRPATDASMPDANWYSFLTEAQPDVFSDLFTRHPCLQYSAPVQMYSLDDGATYVFGVDAAADLIRPMGQTQIFANLRDIPDNPLRVGDDYMIEGSLIRIPNARYRTFAAGPYARFVAMPDVAIDGTHNPVLYPKHARMMLVWKALEYWAARPGSGASPVYFMQKYDSARDAMWIELATTYNNQGAEGAMEYNRWWTISDFAGTTTTTGSPGGAVIVP